MGVLVCIVNYRTPDLVIGCLRSLEPERAAVPELRVAVADGGSGDDSAERIAQAIAENGWSDWCSLDALPENKGFAFGNNALVRPALELDPKPAYFFLLNPDTAIHPGAVKALVDFMDKHREVGVTGSLIYNDDGTIFPSAFRFPTFWSELMAGMRLGLLDRILRRHAVRMPPRDEPHEAQWVSGAAMMVRREVFEQVGLMDEAFFLYYEETDFTRRAVAAGWKTWFVPDSRVIHYLGQSTGVTGTQRLLKPVPRYWFESRRLYFIKNHGRAYTFLADCCYALGHLVHAARMRVLPKENSVPPNFLRDFLRYNFGLRREL
mgnify:CR=1 FL=1